MNLYNSKCKICTSRYSKEINELLNKGRPYSEIIAKYPWLNKSNITNHKKHYPIIPEAIREYQQQLEEGKKRVINDLDFLNDVIRRADEFLQTAETPKELQQATDAGVKAMKLKYEISGDINNPLKDLLDLLRDDDD
jgi:RNA processing factor Prp31